MSARWFWSALPENADGESACAWRAVLPAYHQKETYHGLALAYALVRHAVRQTYGVAPRPEDWQRTEYGKPFLPAWPEIQVNLSHSGQVALCAVDTTPVGVDVQREIAPVSDALVRRVCTPPERRWLEGQPRREAAFATLWTLKESYLKYRGDGLSGGLKTFTVYPAREKVLTDRAGVRFSMCTLRPGYQAALCAGTLAGPPVFVDAGTL